MSRKTEGSDKKLFQANLYHAYFSFEYFINDAFCVADQTRLELFRVYFTRSPPNTEDIFRITLHLHGAFRATRLRAGAETESRHLAFVSDKGSDLQVWALPALCSGRGGTYLLNIKAMTKSGFTFTLQSHSLPGG